MRLYKRRDLCTVVHMSCIKAVQDYRLMPHRHQIAERLHLAIFSDKFVTVQVRALISEFNVRGGIGGTIAVTTLGSLSLDGLMTAAYPNGSGG